MRRRLPTAALTLSPRLPLLPPPASPKRQPIVLRCHPFLPRLLPAHVSVQLSYPDGGLPTGCTLRVTLADGNERSVTVHATQLPAASPGTSLPKHLEACARLRLLAEMEQEGRLQRQYDYAFLAQIGRLRHGLATPGDRSMQDSAINSIRSAYERAPNDALVEQIYLAHVCDPNLI